ncbi:MAG: hypothetical protein JWO07_647, partial [Candidatus Saccharibacteria bacterium]|nr:hypothetical protein [Candidatus Saccharibacteria bacterium]
MFEKTKLFSDQKVSLVVEEKKKLLDAAIKEFNENTYNYRSRTRTFDETSLIARMRIHAAEVTGYEARVKGNEVEFAISFDGSASAFRLAPSDSNSNTTINPTVQDLISGTMYVRVPNTGNAAQMKADFLPIYDQIVETSKRVTVEINEFNKTVSSLVSEAVNENKKRMAQEKT